MGEPIKAADFRTETPEHQVWRELTHSLGDDMPQVHEDPAFMRALLTETRDGILPDYRRRKYWAELSRTAGDDKAADEHTRIAAGMLRMIAKIDKDLVGLLEQLGS